MEAKSEPNLTVTEQIAQAVSSTFHPLTLPAIAFTLLVVSDPTGYTISKLTIEAVAIAFSVILVPGYIFFLKAKGIVDSADIKVRKQRVNPLFIGAVSYFVGFLWLKAIGASNLTQGLMFCYVTNTLLVALIPNWWKVSVHTTAISGPLIVLSYRFGSLMLPFSALIPLVGASRLLLKRHTLAQILVGATIGVLLTALQIQCFFSSV